MVKQKRKTGSKLEKEMSVIESAKIKILEAERRQLESLVGELKVENSNIRGRLQQLESQYYDLTHASDIIKLENKTLSEETERLNLALRQSNAQRDNLLMLSDEQNVKIVELQRLVTILQTADIRQVQEQAISDIRHLQSKIEANDRIMQQRIKEKDDLLADISNQLNAVKKENEILKDSLHNSTFMTQIDLSRSSGGDSRGYESSQEQLIDNNVVDDAYLSGVLGLSESLHEEVNDLTAQVAKEQSPYSHREARLIEVILRIHRRYNKLFRKYQQRGALTAYNSNSLELNCSATELQLANERVKQLQQQLITFKEHTAELEEQLMHNKMLLGTSIACDKVISFDAACSTTKEGISIAAETQVSPIVLSQGNNTDTWITLKARIIDEVKAKLHERFRLKIKKLRRRYEADREKLLRLMRVECENILVESQKVLFQYGELLKSKGQENGQSFGKKSKRRARSEPFPEQQFPDSAVRVVNDLDVAASFCHDESDFDIEKSAVFLHSNQNTTANSLLFSSHDGSVSSFSREKKRNNNMG